MDLGCARPLCPLSVHAYVCIFPGHFHRSRLRYKYYFPPPFPPPSSIFQVLDSDLSHTPLYTFLLCDAIFTNNATLMANSVHTNGVFNMIKVGQKI